MKALGSDFRIIPITREVVILSSRLKKQAQEFRWVAEKSPIVGLNLFGNMGIRVIQAVCEDQNDNSPKIGALPEQPLDSFLVIHEDLDRVKMSLLHDGFGTYIE